MDEARNSGRDRELANQNAQAQTQAAYAEAAAANAKADASRAEADAARSATEMKEKDAFIKSYKQATGQTLHHGQVVRHPETGNWTTEAEASVIRGKIAAAEAVKKERLEKKEKKTTAVYVILGTVIPLGLLAGLIYLGMKLWDYLKDVFF